MGESLAIVMLVACGALISTQATMNATLGRSLGLPLFVVVFSAIQLLFTFPVLLLWDWPPRMASLGQTPWWQYVGGVLGVILLIGMSAGLSRVGTFAGFVALLVGQLTMSMIVDRFALFGAHFTPITWQRLAGFGLVMGGMWLTRL
jgi:transporter family-2 protein